MSDTGCLLTWHHELMFMLLQRIWHRASGYDFNVVSERFDRQAEASKNIRDVSKPETARLLHRHTTTQSSSRPNMLPSVNVTHLFGQLG